VQFAKLCGARVLACASRTDGVAPVRKLGADEAVDGRHADIAAAVRNFAADGLDAVLALAVRDGSLVTYPNGIEPEPQQRSGITIVSYDAVSGVREFEKLGHAVEAAKLKVPIDSEFPLGEAAKAHSHLARGHVFGKVVLQIR
jgi:NADPH2:quinone reductase